MKRRIAKKPVSPYEKVKKQKQRTHQRNVNSQALDFWIKTNHFIQRFAERVKQSTEKVSRDFAWWIMSRKIMYAPLLESYRVKGNKYTYVLGREYELITIYEPDSKLNKEFNKKNYQALVGKWERLLIKAYFGL